MQPIERLRRAFALNNIPWDAELARLPEEKLVETATYWEQRASEYQDVPITELKTLSAIKARLRSLAHIGGLSQAHSAIQHSQQQYHGRVSGGRSV